MVRMYIRHAVEDYDKWRKAYDDFSSSQRELGVKDDGVFQNVEDPKDVTVFHDFDSIETARAFADSDQVKSAMGEAGVAGAPDIWFTESR